MDKKGYMFNEHDRNQVLAKRRQLKEKKRKRRRNAFLVILFISAVAGFLLSDLSKVKSISVDGCNLTESKDIVKGLSIKKNETFFFMVDTKDIEKQVEKMVFIKSAKVEKSFTGEITITVKEDNPILYTYIDNVLYVVDQEGNIQKDKQQKWLSYVQRCPQAMKFSLKTFKEFVKEYIDLSSVVQNQISSIIFEGNVKDEYKCKLELDDGKIFYVRYNDMVDNLTSKNYYLVVQKYPNYKYYDFLKRHVYVYEKLEETPSESQQEPQSEVQQELPTSNE